MRAGQASKQLPPMRPPKDFEWVLQHDDENQMQGLPQDQPCLSLTKLVIQLHANVCGQAAVIDCPTHLGSCPGSCLVRCCLTVCQQLLCPVSRTYGESFQA